MNGAFSYYEPTTGTWINFTTLTSTDIYANATSSTQLYYKAIDSSSKYILQYVPTAATSIYGNWVKIFNYIPTLTYSFTAGTSYYLEIIHQGISMVNVHANFGKSNLITNYNQFGCMSTNIIGTVPVSLDQNEIEIYSNTNIGGRIPYMNNSLTEVEIYLTDEWNTVLTDIDPFYITLTFDHQNIDHDDAPATSKKARKSLGKSIHEK